MTAQHQLHETPDHCPADAEQTDPIGPITLPKRGKVGARALALVGTASLATLAVHALVDGCITTTSIIET
jgi:hypothetical protein